MAVEVALPRDREVLRGAGSIRRLAETVANTSRPILLVVGASSFEKSGARAMIAAQSSFADAVVWSDFSPDIDIEDLRKGREIAAEFYPGTVIGIGGGSAMDMAKLIGAATDGGVEDLVRDNRVHGREHRLVLVPTTAGSGSEATHFAVAYIGAEKHSVAHPRLVPDSVVLDPELLLSASRYQLATSGIDAVCQAIESRWALGRTQESVCFAETALSVLLGAFVEFVDAPTVELAEAMQVGAHLAGRAIDISKTTGAHALAYGITKGWGISHGHAVALTMPGFLGLHADHREQQELADAIGSLVSVTNVASAEQLRGFFEQLCDRVGLSLGLACNGIAEPEDLQSLVATVNHDRLGNNPIGLSADSLARILRGC